jgi:CheY-like chemotaxis protein
MESDLKNGFLLRTGQNPQGGAAESSPLTPRAFGLLVVDDEECVRGVLDLAMKQRGFAVWLASSGKEAISLYRSHGRAIDVVLMDVLMPGLDGPQTLAALQQMNAQVRCCFMSGDLGIYAEWQLDNLGAIGVIRKPFRLDGITALLWELASHALSSPSSL